MMKNDYHIDNQEVGCSQGPFLVSPFLPTVYSGILPMVTLVPQLGSSPLLSRMTIIQITPPMAEVHMVLSSTKDHPTDSTVDLDPSFLLTLASPLAFVLSPAAAIQKAPAFCSEITRHFVASWGCSLHVTWMAFWMLFMEGICSVSNAVRVQAFNSSCPTSCTKRIHSPSSFSPYLLVRRMSWWLNQGSMSQRRSPPGSWFSSVTPGWDDTMPFLSNNWFVGSGDRNPNAWARLSAGLPYYCVDLSPKPGRRG